MTDHHEASRLRYTRGQLDKVTPAGGQVKLQLRNEEGETFWLNITSDQHAAIEKILLTEGGRTTDPSPVSHDPCITGTIDIGGQRSEFLIPLDPTSSTQYSQWGAGNPVLWGRTDMLESLAREAREWAEENLCSVCKENTTDDGEGYDGMCGNCADRSTCVADCSPDDEDLDGPCSECGTDWSKWDGEDHEQFRYEQREEREQSND